MSPVTNKIDIGRLGVWSGFHIWGDATGEPADALAELEELGYGAVWVGGAEHGHSAFGPILSATSRLVLATGIISMWADSPEVVSELHRDLNNRFPNRFLLGLGVSHAPLVEPLGFAYEKPYSKAVSYLDELDAIGAVPRGHLALAALGPRMLKLAADRTMGAHPYLITPEHTALARDTMGPEAVLAPEQKVVIEANAEKARQIARDGIGWYIKNAPNYVNNLRRLGFTEDDFANGGSDRLVDGLVAWGDAETVAKRVGEHYEAGADHVCLHMLTGGPLGTPAPLPRAQWRDIAAALA
jgi:probable F420-dependent oxidoreductase